MLTSQPFSEFLFVSEKEKNWKRQWGPQTAGLSFFLPAVSVARWRGRVFVFRKKAAQFESVQVFHVIFFNPNDPPKRVFLMSALSWQHLVNEHANYKAPLTNELPP